MFHLYQQKKIAWLSALIVAPLFLLFIFWQALSSPVTSLLEPVVSPEAMRYTRAVAELRELQASYQDGLFKLPLFKKLNSVFTLPLQIGGLGTANPFLLPLPPEELLLKR